MKKWSVKRLINAARRALGLSSLRRLAPLLKEHSLEKVLKCTIPGVVDVDLERGFIVFVHDSACPLQPCQCGADAWAEAVEYAWGTRLFWRSFRPNGPTFVCVELPEEFLEEIRRDTR